MFKKISYFLAAFALVGVLALPSSAQAAVKCSNSETGGEACIECSGDSSDEDCADSIEKNNSNVSCDVVSSDQCPAVIPTDGDLGHPTAITSTFERFRNLVKSAKDLVRFISPGSIVTNIVDHFFDSAKEPNVSDRNEKLDRSQPEQLPERAQANGRKTVQPRDL